MKNIAVLGAGLGHIGSKLLAALGSLSSLGSLNVQPGKPPKNHGPTIGTSIHAVHAKLAREGWSLSNDFDDRGRTVRVWTNTRPADWHKRPLSATPTKADVAASRAAEAKRARKAEKLQRDTWEGFNRNQAHWCHRDGGWEILPRLNPLHVAL